MTHDTLLDCRGLEPPEPLERVLEAISHIGPDERVLMLLEREPFPLYRILQQNGYTYRSTARDDGVFEILIGLKS